MRDSSVTKGPEVGAAYAPARLEIQRAAAAAELKLREQELAEVKHGSRPEELAQAEARQKAAEAIAAYAKTKLKRVERLAKQGTVTDGRARGNARFAIASARRLAEAALQTTKLAPGRAAQGTHRAGARAVRHGPGGGQPL